MLKRILAITLCVILALSFAACKKDDTQGASSNVTSDSTQDFDKDKWGEDDELTDEEKEDLKDLWEEGVGNGGATIVTPDSSEQSSSNNSSSSTSSDTSSDGQSSDLETGIILGDSPGIG